MKSICKSRDITREDNPADLGSRGNATNTSLWNQGPAWMSDFLKRPAGIILEPSPEALAEAKGKQEILSLVVRTKDALDHVLKSYQLSRVLRIGA